MQNKANFIPYRQISNVETKYKHKCLAWVSKQKRIALKALKEESAY